MFNQNLKTATQVWNAFSKFLAAQVLSKGRTVDTNMIGMFAPENVFWPSPDFLRASKLKMKSGSLSSETYDELYANQLKAEPKPTALNFGSIALVCASSVRTENAYKILKEIFAQVVSSPHDQAFRLKLKGFGVLKINDGAQGYIEFVSLKELEGIDELGKDQEPVDGSAARAQRNSRKEAE